MDVYPGTGGDGAFCQADGVAVLHDGGAFGDGGEGDLMAPLHVLDGGDGGAVYGEGLPFYQILQGNGHVVRRMDLDEFQNRISL